MKKFSKILTLILALVAILTAFTVVALAVEGGTAKTQAVLNYEGTTAGTPVSTTFVYLEDYPGGNKYLAYNTTGSGGGKSIDYTPAGVASNSAKHKVRDFPIIAYDFDFMTPTGHLGYRDKVANSAGLTPRPYYHAGGHKASDYWNRITFQAMGLSTEKYLWQHVTLIYVWEGFNYTYNDVTASNFYSTYVSINGAEPKRLSTVNYTSKFASLTPGKEDETVLGRIFFYQGNQAHSGSYPDYDGYQCIDNFTTSYFSNEYKTDLPAVSNYIYKNGEYPMPESYKGTVATVTVGETVKYFDDFSEAYEYSIANNGAKIQLHANVTATFNVDSNITVDTRKLDESGVPTAERYTFTPTATTTKGYMFGDADGDGVYTSELGAFMVTTSAGVVTAYPASELVAKLREPGTNSTIKLLSDVEIDPSLLTKKDSSGAIVNQEGAILVKVPFTLDLNGHELRRVYYYGTQYGSVLNEETGEYDDVESTVAAKNGALFDTDKAVAYKITSTAGTNGKIYNVGVKCNTWVNAEGEIERREILSFTHNKLIYSIVSGATIDISNVDVYAGRLVDAVWGNNFLTIRMDNVNYYQMSRGVASDIASNGEWVFHFHGNAGYNIQVSNSLFYLNASVPEDFNGTGAYGTTGLIRFTGSVPNGATAIATFKNCDIISAEDKHLAGVMTLTKPVVFENCRVYNNSTNSATELVASHGTISNQGRVNNDKRDAYSPVAASGWSNKTLSKSITISYDVPAIDSWAATADAIQSVDFGFGTKQQVCTFTKVTTKAVSVSFDGEVKELLPGVSDIYSNEFRKTIDKTDPILNQVYHWVDASGNAANDILGYTENGIVFDWASEAPYALISSETVNGEKKFVGGIEANFNLGFLSGFYYNFYFPVDARLANVNVEGYEQGTNTVLINGEEYTVWSRLVGTVESATESVVYATFEVGGVEYNQSWSISAVKYAELLIKTPWGNYEKPTMGNMVKFIKEAVLLKTPDADVAELNAVISAAEVELTYGEYANGEGGDPADLGVVTGIEYAIYNGVAAYRITTNVKNAPLTFTQNGKTVNYTADGMILTLDAMRIYEAIDPITIANTETGKSIDFSILDYINAMKDEVDDEGNPVNIDVVKALYDFAVNAKAYKEELRNY